MEFSFSLVLLYRDMSAGRFEPGFGAPLSSPHYRPPGQGVFFSFFQLDFMQTVGVFLPPPCQFISFVFWV